MVLNNSIAVAAVGGLKHVPSVLRHAGKVKMDRNIVGPGQDPAILEFVEPDY
jgi:hypothetical protein